MELTDERLYLTPFPLSPLFHMLMLSLATQRQGPKTDNSFQLEYDFIVVGAGSAGSVVASRLSEVPCVNVLLLEAGKVPPKVSDVPSVANSFVQSDIDWKYRTVPQRHTGGATMGRRIILPQGKAFGGGSSINALVANRGNRRNYDEWASLGATGWSYEEVFPYFLRLEDNRDPALVASGWHNAGGPVTVSRQRYFPDIKNPLIESALSLGYEFVDVDGPTQHGLYDLQSTIRDGQRCSTAKAYLAPHENRTNLDILARAFVTKILIQDRRAVGVEFDFRGVHHRVRARREVVVSAGAINTVRLLQLSGIGPLHELDRLKIPLIADLPVGSNLQEHPAGIIAFELGHSITPVHKRLFEEKNVMEYIQNRSGPLAYASEIALLAFLSNNATGQANDIPDHELYFIEVIALFSKMRIGLTLEAYKAVFGPYEKKPLLICLSQILHPKSRGSVRLRSNNPYEPPDIDPNYLDDPNDVKDIVEGMKTCTKILSAAPMASVGAKVFNTSMPGCQRFRPDSDLFLECLVRGAVMSLSHPVGTAKMGQVEDPTTVVDPELRVKTIQSLRVVDASVMPTIPWGNTNIPTIMVAEKASDMIKSTITCP